MYQNNHYHRDCFKCFSCNVCISDQKMGTKNNKIFCRDCFDSIYPTFCKRCKKQFVRGEKKLEYNGKHWHKDCFICCNCNTRIGDGSFIPRGKDIFCNECYQDVHGLKCKKCSQYITSGGLTYQNQPWHRSCFNCFYCKSSLIGKSFTSREDNIVCTDCVSKLFSKQCEHCSQIIKGLTVFSFLCFHIHLC